MSVRRRTGWDVGRWSIPAGLLEASFARAAVLRAREAREVDGVRGLIVFDSGTIQTLNRSGIRRDWLRGDEFEAGLRRLAAKLPILWDGIVLAGELTTGRFATTMAALIGSKAHRADLRLWPSTSPSWPASTFARCPGTTDATVSSFWPRRSRSPWSYHRSSSRELPWSKRCRTDGLSASS
jgi:hypothetical protein